MDALVPAAGEGTRLRPLTADHPKGLVSVGGEPLLAYVFETARTLGAERLVIVIGYRGDCIVDRFGESYEGTPIEYVTQPSSRGLADAIRRARDLVDGHVLLLNGDNVFLDPPARILDVRDRPNVDGGLLVEESEPGSPTGGAAVVVANGTVRQVVEKPGNPVSEVSTTGCYLLPEAIFTACATIEPSDRGEYELADAIQWMIDSGHRFVPVRYEGWRCNVNTPADIARVERRLEER